MISKKNLTEIRWLTPFLKKGSESKEFWREYLQSKNRDVLFILGRGFDPRMNLGIDMVLKAGGSGLREYLLIHYDESPNSPSKAHEEVVKKNYDEFKGLIGSAGIKEVSIKMWSSEGMRVGSINAANILRSSDIQKYSDIIVDISAMPTGIFYPLVGKILSLIDSQKAESNRSCNLHLIVAENAELDERITEEGLDEDAGYMYGFTGIIDTEAAADSPKIWIPILGKNQGEQLRRILNHINPDEACPIFPMPSINPRKVDDLLLEYREFLYDSLRVEPRNFLYADERSPFGLYRELGRTIIEYNKSLAPIGGCKITISPLSGKLLSIGAMLAAYEFKGVGSGVGIAHVEGQGYRMDSVIDLTKERDRSEIFSLWLAGECYEHH